MTSAPAKASPAPADADELKRETPSGESDGFHPRSGVRDIAARGAPAFALTLLLFLFSGATALIDQLCFSKYLSYVVGSTAHAVSAVLAAFMTGLALGAQLGGRISSRIRRPLFGYGVLELVVAGSVALSPLAFDALTRLYVGLARSAPESLATLSVLRWLLAMLLVVVPTTAMGATLPLLARSLAPGSGDEELKQRRLAALYATNTLGGAVGALLGAYAVLPALGIRGTLLGSALVSALVGALAIGLGQRYVAAEPASESAPRSPSAASNELGSRALWVLSVLAFGSGWMVFAAEVVFTHLLALIIGNSAYAFGLILAVFLLCLCLGASRAAAWQRRFGDAALAIGLGGSALSLGLTLPIWDRLPQIFGGLGNLITTFGARETTRALVCFLVLLLPTTLMGLTFPLLLQRVACSPEVGKLVGRLTAINTLGAVTGSLVTGYLLLPALGSQRAIVATALVFAAAALLTRTTQPRLRYVGPSLALSGALVALLVPRWDLVRLTSGTNVYFDQKDRPDELLFLVEDVHGGVTSVTRLGQVHTLYTNGKFQGNDGWELNAQRYFAHYPAPFVRRMDSVLVIGLGTGTTLGTVAAYPWRRIDLIEISPAIVKAAGSFFRGPNRGVLDDPRVRVNLGDGRNFLLVSDARYDLISMELSSVWFAGAANLYSQQFYRLASEHLSPDGILQQWVQLHHIRTRDFAVILHTLRLEFAHVALLYGGGQGILIASQAPLSVSDSQLKKLSALPGVGDTVPDGRSLAELASDTLVTGAGLERFVADTARQEGVSVEELISNDDNLYLEYATPRGNVLPWSSREELIARLLNYRDNDAIAAMWGP